jgi:hypothetical protein
LLTLLLTLITTLATVAEIVLSGLIPLCCIAI